MLKGWRCRRCGLEFDLYPAAVKRLALEDHWERCHTMPTPIFSKLERANSLDILLALASLFETLETSA